MGPSPWLAAFSSWQAFAFSLLSFLSHASLPSLSMQGENLRRNLQDRERSLQSLRRNQQNQQNQVALQSPASPASLEVPNQNQSQRQYLKNIPRKKKAAFAGGIQQGRIVPFARATLSLQPCSVDSQCTTTATRKERVAHG